MLFLSVRVFEMKEIKERGLFVCFKEALSIVSKPYLDFGFSLDLDMFDPKEIPAVCSKESDGIYTQEFIHVFKESKLML